MLCGCSGARGNTHRRCRVVDPEMVILTGGMALNEGSFFDPVRKAVREHHWNIIEPERLNIGPSAFYHTFDAFAGSIGAACAARNRILAIIERDAPPS